MKKSLILFTKNTYLTLLIIILAVLAVISTLNFLEYAPLLDSSSVRLSESDNLQQSLDSNIVTSAQNSPLTSFSDYGGFAHNTNSIYTSEYVAGNTSITKIDKSSLNKEIFLDDTDVRNMIIFEDYMYGFISVSKDEDIDNYMLCRISLETAQVSTFSNTASNKAGTVICGSDALYFTNGSKSIYRINHNGELLSTLYTSSGNNVYIFALEDGFIYFVDSNNMYSLNISTGETHKLTGLINNIHQKPSFYNGTIYAFDSLAKANIIGFDITSGTTSNLLSSEQADVLKIQKDANILIGNDFLFFNSGDLLYYINLNSGLFGIEDSISIKYNSFYIYDNNIALEGNENGSIETKSLNKIYKNK